MKTIQTVLASAALALLTTAGASPRADTGTQSVITSIPVLTATQTVGETLMVCMYHRARPEPFRVVSASCRVGADQCTAFVALRSEGDQMLLNGFDLLNPPVEATGPTCERPLFLSSGVLTPRPGQTARPANGG